jgi:hypothetical protein
MRKQLIWFFLLGLSNCTLHRELFGRYYWIGGGTFGVSQSELENRISTLYANGMLTTNNTLWAPLKADYAKAKFGKIIDFNVVPAQGYSLDKTGRKHFLVYISKNRTFYSYSFWNFRGLGRAHTPCDLLVESVTVLQSDSTVRELEWKVAGPALATLKREVLPIIRKQAKE